MNTDKRPVSDDGGATAVEYAILAALIAGVIVAIVVILGDQVVELFNGVAGSFCN